MVNIQIQELEDILKSKGMHSALDFLNQRVSHRFTAVYHLDKDALQIVELIDKLGDATTAPSSRVSFSQSFCEIAVQESSLVTSDSALDRKLDGRPNQGVLSSYVGLPLMLPGGVLFGTLCHYDYDEQMINDDEFVFLQNAASILPKYL